MTTDATDKLNFEDISFDDMINEGLETAEVSEEVVTEKPAEETPTATETVEEVKNELDEDAKALDTVETKIETEPEEKVEEKVEEDPIEEQLDDSVVGEVLKSLGYDIGDKTYDDTSEGIVELTKDVGTKIAQDHMKELMEAFPLVKNHLEYVMSGGDSEQFMATYDPKQDYALLNIGETDTHMQKMLIANYFKFKGHDDAFIKEMVEDYEDGGKLFNKSQIAQKTLVNAQKEQRAHKLNEQKQMAAKQREDTKHFWNDVYSTIDKSKEFSGIRVPQNEKKKFFNYLSNPVTKDGFTQRDKDHNDASLEVKLAIDYLMFKGFKLDDIIKNKVGTAKAKDLKSRLKQSEKRVKSAKGAARRNTGFDIEDLDLSVI